MKSSWRRLVVVLLTVLSLLALSAAPALADDSSDKRERIATDAAAKNFTENQPFHRYDYSQARDNMIAAQDAMALGTSTYTVQTVEGVGRTFECPSIGFPLPFGTQLSNPEKKLNNVDVTLPQEEPYGLYPPPDVRATLANCVLPNGTVGIFYSEPDLTTFGFSVQWNPKTGMFEIPNAAVAGVHVNRVDPKKVNVRNASTG